jgi:hypothetical protein
MNMNPMQLAALLRGRDPRQVVMSMIQNNGINDPMINELVGYAQKGDVNSVTKIAENFFGQRGQNFGQEFNAFMSMLK